MSEQDGVGSGVTVTARKYNLKLVLSCDIRLRPLILSIHPPSLHSPLLPTKAEG